MCQLTDIVSAVGIILDNILLLIGRECVPMRMVLAKGSFHLCVSTFLKYDIYFQIPEGKLAKRKSENDIPPVKFGLAFA